jgi:diguanylate cyclase (GGDEF)-like protein
MTTAQAPMMPGAKARVFIVEDEAITALDLKEKLVLMGYEVIGVADNGYEAKTRIREQGADLALVDIRLTGGEDGIELARYIREHYQSAVVFLTAHSDDQTVRRALSVSPSGFLTKPFQPRALRNTIEVALELQKRENAQEKDLQHLRDREQHLLTVNAALTRLASQDALTGIPNRRAFDSALDREWRRLSREQKSLALVMIDIDDFKAYNDLYGHPAGDKVLRAIAHAIMACCQRPGDIACRLGGEEFALILPDTGRDEAIHMAEQVLASVHALGLVHAGSSVADHVTLSAGVAVGIPVTNHSPEWLTDAADAALYRAKRKGRNGVST